MRIVAGAWRGRTLSVPPGQGTRPTADRVRQALFDMLMHAPWAGREVIQGASVLDVFAGTGALGLEALSRGAASACFIESDPVALRVLSANVASCKAEALAQTLAVDALKLAAVTRAEAVDPAGPAAVKQPASLVFLDPPYGLDLVPRALDQAADAGFIGAGALIVAETGRDETWMPDRPLLAERRFGAARVMIFRAD